jgi:hypothetical protein
MRDSNQKERLAKFKQGAGTFVYQGGAFDTEAIPGVPAKAKDGSQLRAVVFKTYEDEDGKQHQVVDPDASEKGELVWKKAPRFKRIPLETLRLRIPGVYAERGDDGVLTPKTDANGDTPALWLELPKGKKVYVGDPRLALKLRTLGFCKEIEADAPEAKEKPKPEAKEKSAAPSAP